MWGVEDLETLYKTEDMVASFHKCINLSSMGYEGDLMLKPCNKDEGEVSFDLEGFFYMYLNVVYRLWPGI